MKTFTGESLAVKRILACGIKLRFQGDDISLMEVSTYSSISGYNFRQLISSKQLQGKHLTFRAQNVSSIFKRIYKCFLTFHFYVNQGRGGGRIHFTSARLSMSC